jgi:hypothetical protein
MDLAEQRLREALADIVDGANVKRAKHELTHEGRDLTGLFLEVLRDHGYVPLTVDAVPVEPGERVPAFLLEGATAYFGWVFWEQFTSWKIRKLWGSVIRNALGDWEIQIPPSRPTTIYANVALKLEMDIDHPGGF